MPQCAKLDHILKPFSLLLNMFDPYCSRLSPVVLLKNSNFYIYIYVLFVKTTSNYSNHSKTSEDCKVENHLNILNTMKNHLNHLITRKPFKKEAFVGDPLFDPWTSLGPCPAEWRHRSAQLGEKHRRLQRLQVA